MEIGFINNSKFRIAFLSVILILLFSFSLNKIYKHYVPRDTGDYMDLVYNSFEGAELNSLEKDGNTFYITGEDPYILLNDINVFTKQIEISLSDLSDIGYIRLYYSSDGIIRGDHFIDQSISEQGKSTFQFDRHISSVRVDLEGSLPNGYFTIDKIKVENGLLSRLESSMKIFYWWAFMGVLLFLCMIFYALKFKENIFVTVLKAVIFNAVYYLVFALPYNNLDYILPAVLIFSVSFITIFSYGVIKEKYFYIWLYIMCFLLYLCWTLIVPYDHAPDEYMRYDIPLFIYKNGYIPYGWEESIRNPIWGFSYGFHPSLASYLAAFFMKISDGFLEENKLYMAARFVSVIFGTGTVIIAKKIGDKLFTPEAKLLLCTSIAFLPQFMFISGYFNNDAFGFFTVALTIYAMIICKESAWGIKECIVLGVGCGLCGLSYYNCCCIIGSAIVFALWDTVSKKETRKLSFISKRFMIVFLVAFIIAGWAYIRNYINYDGDFLGLKTRDLYGEMYAQEYYKPSVHPTSQNTGESLMYMIFDRGWLSTSLKSSIGVFSYMLIYLKENIYLTVEIILGLGILMAVIYAVKSLVLDKKVSAFWLSLVLNCILVFVLGVMYSYTGGFQPQGRYLMPMLVSFNMIFVLGYDKILSFNKYVKNIVLYGISIFYVLLGVYSLFGVIVPFYH